MKNVWYSPSIEEHSDEIYELRRKYKIRKSLQITAWSIAARYQKVTFSIPLKASINHTTPIGIDAKNNTRRDLIDISKHKIKMYTIDRRTRSGQ